MTTSPLYRIAHSSRWFDGWSAACHELRRTLADPGTCCPNHAIDRVVFQGIAAAAEAHPEDLPTHAAVVTAAADSIMATALDPGQRPGILGQCRVLADGAPEVAADVMAQLALIVARHATEDLAAP